MKACRLLLLSVLRRLAARFSLISSARRSSPGFQTLRPAAPCGDMESMAIAINAWTDLKGARIGIGGQMLIGKLLTMNKTNFP